MRSKWIIATILIWCAGPAGSAMAHGQDVAVVVNPSNATSALSLSDVRKLFAGEKRTWPGGPRVKLIVRMPGCQERATLLHLLGMARENEYSEYWKGRIFRGDADAEPAAVPSVGMQKEAIGAYPGAITFVAARDVKPGMKIVKVDGHLPDEPGYPLH